MTIELEICIGADDMGSLKQQAEAARLGGAKRVELCAAMAQDGLSPTVQAMELARQGLGQDVELLVMIRPRGGHFCYQIDEILMMQQSILQAACSGADGIVLGLLTQDQQLDIPPLRELVTQAKALGLKVTFHRAFDALSDPQTDLQQLITLGIDRVLTSGTPWQSSDNALQGLSQLVRYLQHSRGQIEIVVGGGVSLDNLPLLAAQLVSEGSRLSFHTHSAVMLNGKVNIDKVTAVSAMLNNTAQLSAEKVRE